MTSLLFETSITYSLQHLGCEVMTFKPHQRASVRYVYVGKVIFLLLPTGFGKSLCYEVLPFMFDVMQCSVTLHSLTTEVHQVLRCSLQLSHALCASVLWQTIIFSYSYIQQVSKSGGQFLCRGCMLGRHCCPTHTTQASHTKRDLGSTPCESLYTSAKFLNIIMVHTHKTLRGC